jgi:hypothetical protein
MLDWKGVNFPQQIVERRSAGLTVAAGPRCGAKAFDDLERFPSFQPLDHASKRAG